MQHLPQMIQQHSYIPPSPLSQQSQSANGRLVLGSVQQSQTPGIY